jgi:putative selenium metabolism protein SsnA
LKGGYEMIGLKNATLVHLHPAEVADGVDVVIDGTRIAAVGPGAAASVKAETTLDLTGCVLMPGLVCGHNHFYSGLARGIMARIAPCPDFVSTLANLWWRLDRALDRGSLRAGGMVCAAEAIRCGCTAVVDHHASPSFITGSLDVLKGCFETVGLRGVECYETTDRNGIEAMQEGVEENRSFARSVEGEKKKRGPERLVEALIGGHAPFTITDAGLEALGRACVESGRGFHVHAAEDAFDPSYSHRFHGTDLMQRLDAFGLLGETSVIAHGLYLTDGDRELINQRGAFLAHNPRSNMNNAVGYNRALPALKAAVLGTDGIGSDMFEETRFAYFKHRDAGGSLWPADFVRMLQAGNDLLARLFGERFGRVEKGYKADLVVMDYRPPTPLLAGNVAGHFVFGMSGRDVRTVIVNGRVVMRDRVLDLDEAQLYAEAREAARGLWSRMDALG